VHSNFFRTESVAQSTTHIVSGVTNHLSSSVM
jgi:hypothetical protein